MNKKYIILFALIIGTSITYAQSLKRFKEKATKAFEAKDFSRALEYYQMMIVDAEDETGENYYKAGEAAREFRIYSEAEKYYRVVLTDSTAATNYPLTSFHLGTVLKNQGRYDEAIRYYQLFLDKNASFVSESFTVKAEKEIDDCEWAKTLPITGAEVIQMDSTINTPNSEFGPIIIGNELYFSSVRYKTNAEYLPETPLTRIYVSKDNNLGEQVSEDFNEDLMHSAHATFNEGATTVYYTVCSSLNATEVRCKIYYREKTNDKWGKRVILSDKINQEGYTATQPNIGFDNKSGKEALFFVSDRPTDEDDTDKDLNIWCSLKDGDSFGLPFAIEEVNTPEDDVTPFFDTKSQTLYFSSNGRQNMGGHDIYSINKNNMGWETVNHMGTPLNSSYDDLYYSLNEEGTNAYLSSNRKGSTCDDENGLCGCNDIYEVPQIKIRVLTFNSITKEPLNGTTVTLDELKSNFSNLQSKEQSNEYNYAGRFNIEYKVDAQLDGWIYDDSLFNTMNVQGGAIIEIPLYLTPAVDLDALTFSKATLAPLPGVKVELFEVIEEELFIDEKSLGAKEDRNSVQYNYGIDYAKKYMVVGSKFGYSRDTFFVTTKGIPVVPTHLVDSLYLCKAAPELTKLYFYNDEPNRRTRTLTTDWSYVKAYESLTSEEIKNDFTRELSSEIEETGKILRFFNDVDEGMEMLDSFTNLLLTDKSYIGNNNIKVIVRGFASPRAQSDYNLKLTSRRIESIRNYFERRGLLEMYPGQIIFDYDPNGEEKAPKGLVDDIADRKKSIYYEGPSRERRVEIVWILDSPDACVKKESTEVTE